MYRSHTLTAAQDAPDAEARPTDCYVLITPAFNEAAHLQETIDSVVGQTRLPEIWVLVDDGSTDATGALIDAAAAAHPWIHALHRQKQPGSEDGLLVASEAKAFLEGLGLARAVCPEPGFIGKLDADLVFESDYFAELLAHCAARPRVGIVGGSIYEREGDELVKEAVNPLHVRGATKVYRRACYEEIGGMRPVFGWDVADEFLARSKGWDVCALDPPTLVHLRPTGTRDGQFHGWARHGRMAHHLGFSPLRTAARVVYRTFVLREWVQAAGLAVGYAAAWLSRTPRIADLDVRDAVRNQQWKIAS